MGCARWTSANEPKAMTRNQPTRCEPNRLTNRSPYEGTVSCRTPAIKLKTPKRSIETIKEEDLVDSKRPCPNAKHGQPLFWTRRSKALSRSESFALSPAHKLGRTFEQQVLGQPWQRIKCWASPRLRGSR